MNLAYDDRGSGEPVLFIAGRGGAGRTWHVYQVPEFLRAGYRTVTFDNRGIGATASADGFGTAQMVADTAELIDTLDLAPVRIVAASMGSFIAQELMLAHPELVRSAVLMATRGRHDHAREFFRTAERELAASGIRLPPTYDARLRLVESFSPKTLNDDRAVRDWIEMFTLWPSEPTPGLRRSARGRADRQSAAGVSQHRHAGAGHRVRRRPGDPAASGPRGRRRPAQRALPADSRYRAPGLHRGTAGGQRRGAEILRRYAVGVNPSTAQARVVVDELIRGGVRDVVLCPGSRNAPLAFALHDADRAGALRLHVRIDERTAGFLAVGLAVAQGAPVCVAMTSGTAVANLGPAVVEANYARVPLIVLSANRPYELLGTGANQTFEQLGYFGTQVRAMISVGLAEDAPERLTEFNAQWRSATCRVLAAATGARTANAGPVQFDIPLREPLVPDAEGGPADRPVPAGRPGGRPWTYTPPVSFDQPLEIDLTPDTVVIAGHGAGVQPNLASLPTVAEPTAPVAETPLHPLALPLLRPQQVIMLGRPTLHRPVSALLADPSVPVYALTTGPRWPDVSGNSQATGTRALTTGEPNPAWLHRCAEVHRHAMAAVHGQLRAHPLTTGLHVAAAVADALRPGDQLVLGASNPVRDAALVGLRPHGIAVRSNRGVAGIDGTVSTAIGAALAHERVHADGRTVALIGDLTFVHDSSGLLIGPTEPTPRRLTIVVSNDNGGGIFELLEQGDPRFSDVSSRIFGTPHDVDVGALCRSYHVDAAQIEVDELAAALAEPFDGLRVLEVKADRSSLRALHASIKAAL